MAKSPESVQLSADAALASGASRWLISPKLSDLTRQSSVAAIRAYRRSGFSMRAW
jgi:hypothetical protein